MKTTNINKLQKNKINKILWNKLQITFKGFSAHSINLGEKNITKSLHFIVQQIAVNELIKMLKNKINKINKINWVKLKLGKKKKK